jgi:Transposase DDE domain
VQQASTQASTSTTARILVVDASSFSMSDTPSLRRRFGLPKGRKVTEGIAYPVARFIGLLDLASGLFTRLMCGSPFQHEMGMIKSLHPILKTGDILLGDRAFCSYVHFALLQLRGVLICTRLHQMRKIKPGERSQRWDRPKDCPKWMCPDLLATLPEWIVVRIVSYKTSRRGFRTREIHIATTLPDDAIWTDAKVADLYGKRWQIETCFNHLKTTMKMDVLKCQSAAGVIREQMMYLLAYNLIRLTILKWSRQEGVDVWRVSFIDALRKLSALLMGLAVVDDLIINPDRPGREQPRARRRRMKEYDLLMMSRNDWKNRMKTAK